MRSSLPLRSFLHAGEESTVTAIQVRDSDPHFLDRHGWVMNGFK